MSHFDQPSLSWNPAGSAAAPNGTVAQFDDGPAASIAAETGDTFDHSEPVEIA